VTDFALVNKSGTEVFRGTQRPPQGGGSQPGAVVTMGPYEINFDDSGILTPGVELFQPAVGDQLLLVWAHIAPGSEWDGSSPSGALVPMLAGVTSADSLTGSQLDMATSDVQPFPTTFSSLSSYPDRVPAAQWVDDAVPISWLVDDGGGGPTGSSQGQCFVYAQVVKA
jgi:hypothetical protein